MRNRSLFLSFLLLSNSVTATAQSEISNEITIPPVSCQDQIRKKLDKLPAALTKATATTAGSFGAGFGLAYMAMWSPVVAGGSFVAVYATGLTLLFGAPIAGGSILAVRKHRKNMLEIFEGAASGGNKKTEKMWRLALKKDINAFKGMTYEQFLQGIREADSSGKACETETIPERKDVINVVIDLKELDDDEKVLGEKDAVVKEAQTDSSTRTSDKTPSLEIDSASPPAKGTQTNQQ